MTSKEALCEILKRADKKESEYTTKCAEIIVKDLEVLQDDLTKCNDNCPYYRGNTECSKPLRLPCPPMSTTIDYVAIYNQLSKELESLGNNESQNTITDIVSKIATDMQVLREQMLIKEILYIYKGLYGIGEPGYKHYMEIKKKQKQIYESKKQFPFTICEPNETSATYFTIPCEPIILEKKTFDFICELAQKD